jgi:hypothetical protein
VETRAASYTSLSWSGVARTFTLTTPPLFPSHGLYEAQVSSGEAPDVGEDGGELSDAHAEPLGKR